MGCRKWVMGVAAKTNQTEKHRRFWRITLLVFLLTTFLGPWAFELVWVPSDLTCSAPYTRLDDDFCGVSMSGIWLFRWAAENSIDASAGMAAGELDFSEWIREDIFCLLFCLPLLPIFSTAGLIIRTGHKHTQSITVTAWVLAIGTGLVWGLNQYPNHFWLVWGTWLYTMVAISGLVLEMIVTFSGRKGSRIRLFTIMGVTGRLFLTSCWQMLLDSSKTYHSRSSLVDLDSDGDLDVILNQTRWESVDTSFAGVSLWLGRAAENSCVFQERNQP